MFYIFFLLWSEVLKKFCDFLSKWYKLTQLSFIGYIDYIDLFAVSNNLLLYFKVYL